VDETANPSYRPPGVLTATGGVCDNDSTFCGQEDVCRLTADNSYRCVRKPTIGTACDPNVDAYSQYCSVPYNGLLYSARCNYLTSNDPNFVSGWRWIQDTNQNCQET
jgi:hypothetical protein